MSLRHAILGFIDLEPTTGYTLNQRFAGSVGSFWTATQSQIYRELHTLADEQLVGMEVEPQDGKPARKVYRLTKAGKQELKRWLEAPVEPLQLRDPLLLKLVFAAQADPAAIDANLARYAEDLQTRKAEYHARLGVREIFDLARSDRERTLWQLSIENGLMWCEAQLAWTAKARARLSATRKPHSKKEKS